MKKKQLEVILKTSENPNGYWCKPCGRSREWAEQWCSSDDCTERRGDEDLGSKFDYNEWRLFRF